jgi:hypothetical protein
MTTLDWFLVALLILEFFFALDCFKKMLKAQKNFKGAHDMFAGSVKILGEKEAEMLGLRQLVRTKVTECNYLRELLDEYGIEWESGWRKLS